MRDSVCIPSERTDLIAQAYRGRLTCRQALELAQCLLVRANHATTTGYVHRRSTPLDVNYSLRAFELAPILEITP